MHGFAAANNAPGKAISKGRNKIILKALLPKTFPTTRVETRRGELP